MAKKSNWSKAFKALTSAISFLLRGSYTVLKLAATTIYRGGKWIYHKLQGEVTQRQIQAQKPRDKPTYKQLEVAKTNAGSLEAFETRLNESKSTVGLILGARGSGKSAIGMRILENIAANKGRPVCAMGFLPETLPTWITAVNKIEDVKNNSFVLIDEGGILFSSRGSMTNVNKVLSEFLLIARHKNLSILFISQNSANLEINVIRQADYLLLKKSSLLQKDFERKKIKELYDDTQKEFNELAPQHGNKLTYIYSDEFRGFTTNELPTFWSEKTSKAFKEYKK